MESRSSIALNAFNIIAYVMNVGLVSGIPYLFSLPDNAAMSAKYQTLVTPAGWAFAIWGLIFLMQAIWAAIQFALPIYRTNPLVVQGVGYNYIGVCALQVAWTFAFGLEQISVSLIWMLGILFYLVRIHISLQKVLEESDSSFSHNFWLLRFPFDLHLGWIVAATLVSFNLVLQAHVDSAAVKFAAAIVSVVTAFVAAEVLCYRERAPKNPKVVIPLVLTWALVAISKELQNPKSLIIVTYSAVEIDAVKNASMVAATVILVSVIGLYSRALWKNHNESSEEGERLLNQS